jgi:hypothetical protein
MSIICRALGALSFAALSLTAAPAAEAQIVVDTTYTWRAYASVAECRLRIYRTVDPDRGHLVILGEAASNPGPSIMSDARYLVTHVGRDFNIQPSEAHWVFHWGSFSHDGARESRKEIFLRSGFRDSDGLVSTPQWRVVDRDQLEELTNRAFR